MPVLCGRRRRVLLVRRDAIDDLDDEAVREAMPPRSPWPKSSWMNCEKSVVMRMSGRWVMGRDRPGIYPTIGSISIRRNKELFSHRFSPEFLDLPHLNPQARLHLLPSILSCTQQSGLSQ